MYVHMYTGSHVYLDNLTGFGFVWKLFAFISRVESQHCWRPKLTELYEVSLNVSWRKVVLGRFLYLCYPYRCVSSEFYEVCAVITVV
jgi:hypothetical protein